MNELVNNKQVNIEHLKELLVSQFVDNKHLVNDSKDDIYDAIDNIDDLRDLQRDIIEMFFNSIKKQEV